MATRLGGEPSREGATIFFRVSRDSNMLRRHFLPGADASHARVAYLTISTCC